MNEKLLHMLNGRTDLYPKNLEQQFQRVLNRIIELWYSPAIDDYFTALLIDSRGGRQGFPLEVVSELFVLSSFNAKLRSQEQQRITASNPWENVEHSKKTAIAQQGYDFSPQGFLQSAEKGNLNAVALFLSSGINIDTRDARGWTPLIASSFHGNEGIALLLIRNFADIHAKDTGGYGSLHWAAFKGYDNVVKLLIEKGVDTNTLSNHGWTPLLQASSRGHLIAARHLINGGANVNLATHDGWTPLHKAAAGGHTEMVKLLLARGANRDAEYQDGTTPLALAAKNKHDDIVSLLT
jgi:ankyrin repeat protein